jgi:Cu/Ag efflux pump CusA
VKARIHGGPAAHRWGLEEGSALLHSVALVLIGGLLTSTLLTLVFVPAMAADRSAGCDRIRG